jgi:hypothetical protein
MSEIDRDKAKLSSFLERNLKVIQKRILDLSEVAIPKQNYSAFRSKILGITNDFRRDLEKELLDNYNIKYSPKTVVEDIVTIVDADKKPLTLKIKERE